MDNKRAEILNEKMLRLSEKRTELSYERTIMSYARTSVTAVIFGMALIEFSKMKGGFTYNAAIASIVLGLLLGIFTIQRYFKHKKSMEKIKDTFLKGEKGIIDKIMKSI